MCQSCPSLHLVLFRGEVCGVDCAGEESWQTCRNGAETVQLALARQVRRSTRDIFQKGDTDLLCFCALASCFTILSDVPKMRYIGM
jgi:hypothetical protein